MTALRSKFKDVMTAVVPIIVIVLLLHLTIAPLGEGLVPKFFVGSVLVIIGLTVFLFGIDQSIDPIGHGIGNMLAQSGKASLVLVTGVVLGFFISFAEPDLHILARQVSDITEGQFGHMVMVIVVSIGIGVMMTLAMFRILKNFPLKYTFLLAYGLIFILSMFSSSDFLAIAFDSSGATTGALTTPFMLALAAGVSAMKKNSKTSEADSFGLVGISSSGAIIGVLSASIIMGLGKLTGTPPASELAEQDLLGVYGHLFPTIALETIISLAPIVVSYIIIQIFFLKQSKGAVSSIFKGLIMTYVGLLLFLTGVNGGFMEVGREVGKILASMDSKLPVLAVSFILGLVTVLAEPAVIVLTHQVEDITGGYVKRPLVLVFLFVAVGLAIFMATLRTLVPAIQLWMYLLFGFGFSVLLAFFTPDLFVGIAFDAGGVASGPMTATFSLAFIQGIAISTPTADIVTDGFGMIAIVAMMPIIALQTLGLIYRLKTRKG
ncbi:MAG: DUF1538 domain-containing protein [Ruminococcaceae bacterium]|nr:DUF1538 domain-containing protein [Oscillospiraceae bacterium]